jgi:hypothetical protein
MAYKAPEPDGEDKNTGIAGLPTAVVNDNNQVIGTNELDREQEKDISEQDTDEITKKITRRFKSLDYLRYRNCSQLYMALFYDMIDINKLNGIKPFYAKIPLTAEQRVMRLEKEVSAYCVKEKAFEHSDEYCGYLEGALYALKVGDYAGVKRYRREVDNFFSVRKKSTPPDLIDIIGRIEKEAWEKRQSTRLQIPTIPPGIQTISLDDEESKEINGRKHDRSEFKEGEHGRLIVPKD